MSEMAGYMNSVSMGTRPRFGWPVVAAALVVAYLNIGYVSPLLPSRVNVYLAQPLLWLLPAALVLFFVRRGAESLPAASSNTLLPAVSVGVLQVGLGILAALLFGFGHSPYSHTPLAIIGSVWYAGSILAAREVCRWFIVRSLRERGELLAVAVTWALFWITSVSPHAVGQLSQPGTAFDYLGRIALPAAGASLLATYLALLGGPLASSAYLGVLLAFEWLSPILPNLPWPVAALIGVMVPIIGLTVFLSNEDEDAADATGEADRGLSPALLIAGTAILIILWFNTGVFGVRPAIINGISMEPTMHTGDVAITRQVAVEDLGVGDIIRFRQGHRDVLHRIIEIRQTEAGLEFITLGDNNPAPDPPVAADQVEGELVLRIPKLGWPAIGFKLLVTRIFG